MSNFELKTHKVGKTYNAPHFFILNKGLNSGKPMDHPCPNCFVVTTQDEEIRELLFYMCLSLKAENYFLCYLQGSVIPFICISVMRKIIKTELLNNDKTTWKKKVIKLKKIDAFEENMKLQLKAINELKIALLTS